MVPNKTCAACSFLVEDSEQANLQDWEAGLSCSGAGNGSVISRAVTLTRFGGKERCGLELAGCFSSPPVTRV